MHRYKEEAGKWAQLPDDIVEENIGDEAGFSLDLSDDGTHLAVGSAFNDNTGGASADTFASIILLMRVGSRKASTSTDHSLMNTQDRHLRW